MSIPSESISWISGFSEMHYPPISKSEMKLKKTKASENHFTCLSDIQNSYIMLSHGFRKGSSQSRTRPEANEKSNQIPASN
jgi:hypothetical protein